MQGPAMEVSKRWFEFCGGAPFDDSTALLNPKGPARHLDVPQPKIVSPLSRDNF